MVVLWGGGGQAESASPHVCVFKKTHGSCYISLFKFKSFDQLDPPPRAASNFRYLLSCGTIQTSFLIFSFTFFHFLLDGTLAFITIYYSINVKFFAFPQCFTLKMMPCFYTILRAFVLYSHYGNSTSSKNLMDTRLLNL